KRTLLGTEDSTIRRLVPGVEPGFLKELNTEAGEHPLPRGDNGGNAVLPAGLLHLVTEDLKGREHLSVRVMGIAAARIRQEKNLRSGKLPGGQSKIEWAFHMFLGRKEHAKNRDTQESHNRRLVASDFSFSARGPLPHFTRGE